LAGEAAPRVLSRGVTSSEASAPAIDKPSGETPRAGQSGWNGSFREVSAYSTVCPEFASEAAHRRRQIRQRSKMDFDGIPRWYRKAYNLPLSPRLPTARCRLTCVTSSAASWLQIVQGRYAGHLSSYLLNPLARSASGAAVVVGWCISLEAHTSVPVWEISTQNRHPHIAMSYNPSIAWKASLTRTPPPICTSAPFP